MGAWGYQLFNSDNEFDVVISDIDEQASKLAKDPKLTLYKPKNKKRVVKKLNDGLFHEVLQLFISKEWKHGVIYLAVLSMMLGAIIPATDLAYVAQTLKETPMYQEAKTQVQKGLEGYKNIGEPFDFESKSIIDAANASVANEQQAVGGFQMLNVMEKWSLMPQGMPGGPNDMEKGLKELLEHKEGSGILLLFFKLFLYLIYVTIGQAGGTGKVPKPATEPKPSDDLSQEEKNRMQAAVLGYSLFSYSMYRQLFSVAALAATTFAQNATNSSSSGTPSLTQLLGSTDSLSTLRTAIQGVPGLGDILGSATNVTVLAPSNEAFEKFMSTPQGAALADNDQDAIQALLQYHIINGTYPASAVTDMPVFLPTMLNNTMYANVTGGQVVEAVMQEENVIFYSGLLNNATVSTADQNFTGGVVHIIDNVLTVPRNISSTATSAGLSAVVGALSQAQLVDTVQSLSDVTIFAPNNSAFQAIGSALPNLTMTQLAGILSYHVVNGTVAYSSMLENDMTVPALAGGDLRITISDGDVFVNSAKVLIPDVLVANGVVHVIDNVLNPNNTMAMPEPTVEVQSAAFEGATSTDNLGSLTSGVPTPTSAEFGAGPTPAESEETASGGGAMETGAPAGAAMKKEGAIAMAALFAAGGVYMNA
ncbi:MAG: hypothetical protein LQ339_008845 [Xanthoria mediterranea]|nr:MAG: hypothetical protein LQ339_008845 [Xanthoria mediterranea]